MSPAIRRRLDRHMSKHDEMRSVASDWVVGLFAVLGAGLGSAGTLAASWTATRTERDLAADSRSGRTAEVRRNAYAEYLTTVDSFADRARAVVAALENGAPMSECEAAFRAYAAEWEDLQRKCAPVVIAGPPDVGDRAAELRGQLGAMADECDRWYKAYMQAPTRMRAGRFLEAQQAVREARGAFITAAQAQAYGPSAAAPQVAAPGRSGPAWWRTVLRRAS
jgi:hypothetical protein